MTDKFKWVTKDTRTFLKKDYLLPNVTVEERITQIAQKSESLIGIEGFGDKFYDYMSKGWISLSSPIWSNYGLERGLGISCYSIDIQDDMSDILRSVAEIGMLSKYGGGTAGYFGKLRPRGSVIKDNGFSNGSVNFMEIFNTTMNVTNQGCYDDKTEVLTDKGWKLFKEVISNKDLKIAQVLDNEQIEYVSPIEYFEYDVKEDLIYFKDSRNIDLLVTKNHNMVYKQERKSIVDGKYTREVKDNFYMKSAESCPLHRDIKYLHSGLSFHGDGLSFKERLLIAFQADGGKVQGTKKALKFRFSKIRKVERLKWILDNLKLKYSENYYEKDNTYNIYVNVGEEFSKTFDWVSLEKVSQQWCDDFINEALMWDGSFCDEINGSYSSIKEINVDVLQHICSISGYKSYKKINFREKEVNKSCIYSLYISKGNYFGVEKLKKETVYYEGKVYCVEVPTNRLIVRRNGRTVVCGNSVRRGSFAAYLPIEHLDIKEFLEIREQGHPIQNLSIGVTITNEWLEDMIQGDIEKRKLWARVLQKRAETGYPYLFFTDTVNDNKPQVYKDKNLQINQSNLCVSENTKILTDKGYAQISTLQDTFVNIWNGEQFSQSYVSKTGVDQKLYKVTTNSGYELDCTAYHKWYVLEQTDSGKRTKHSRYKEVRTTDLKTGDKLIKFDLPIIEGSKELEYAYDNGFYSGDGCKVDNHQRIYLYGDKALLKDNLKSIETWYDQPKENRSSGHTKLLQPKFFVPGTDYTIQSRLEWLAGYLDANGTVASIDNSQTLQIGSVEYDFIKEVQLMLQTLGVDSKVTFARLAGEYMLPANDGTGENKLFQCKEINRLLINGNSLHSLIMLGLKCNRLKWIIKKPNRKCSQFIKIKSVIKLAGTHDTYCFNEPLRHMGMFNGLLTGQCSEIMLPTNDKESFVCCLSSVNLLHYDEWKDTDLVQTVAMFLDTVLDDYIEKAKKIPFMEKTVAFSENHRAIGIGVLGWHSYLQKNMIPFEGLESKFKNSEVFQHIDRESLKASKFMAQLKGEPTILKGYGERWTTRQAIAPTTSSSFILGQVSPSIEPLHSNYFIKDLAKGKFTYKNPYLKELLKTKKQDNDDTWRSILVKGGSVQHLEFLTEEEKEVFKTFSEISQLEIIQQAAQRQKYIDQGQSLNLMIPSSASAKEVNTLILEAWKLGIKTLYYQRSSNVAQEIGRSLMECKSCES